MKPPTTPKDDEPSRVGIRDRAPTWHNATEVTSTVDKKRAPFPIEFYRSAIGKKWIMAISGLAIIGFAIAHMIGNLKIFLPPVDGVPDIDVYGHALRELFVPIFPEHSFLWILRTGLIVMFALHVHAAYALTIMNRRARPTGTTRAPQLRAANYASRTMRWSGVIFLIFVVLPPRRPHLGHPARHPRAWERGGVRQLHRHLQPPPGHRLLRPGDGRPRHPPLSRDLVDVPEPRDQQPPVQQVAPLSGVGLAG
jgi:hypothetical protein